MSEWNKKHDRLTRVFEFKSFADAISFMVRVSYHAEDMNHHPEWKNVYNKVFVELTTHDVGGVTELDYKLSEYMDDVFRRFQ